jgi:type III secretion system low calcium response chaperone LcrH/SycD
MGTTKKGGGDLPKEIQDLLKNKKPEDLTASDKEKILAAVDKQTENMTVEDVMKAVERGDIEIEYVDPPNPIDNFTPENFKKFLFGKITWAQLEGMTMEQAYSIAEFGYTMYQQGRYKDARTLFEGLVIGNPYDPYFHAMLGAIYTKLDLHEEAAQEFSIAIELDPEDINSYVNRGELLLQHGEFEAAMEDLKAAIELDPKGENPASLRARALAAATAAVIKELIDRRGAAGGAKPTAAPAQKKSPGK